MAKSDLSRPAGVSDRQSLVIDLLLQGATHQEAGKKVGVVRTTVTDWVNHNECFISELSARRVARQKASAECVNSVVLKALRCIEVEIDGQDVRSAVALLKLVGMGHLMASATLMGNNPIAEPTETVHTVRERAEKVLDERAAVLRQIGGLSCGT